MAFHQIGGGEIKAEALEKRQASLKEQIEQRQFIKGDIRASAEKLISLTGNEDTQTLSDEITGLIGKENVGAATFLFQIIGKQLKEVMTKFQNPSIVVFEFRAYPLAYKPLDKLGLAMVYFNIYMEKLPIFKNGSWQEQIVMVCAYRVVVIPKTEKQ